MFLLIQKFSLNSCSAIFYFYDRFVPESIKPVFADCNTFFHNLRQILDEKEKEVLFSMNNEEYKLEN
jgi:hypothetical protein